MEKFNKYIDKIIFTLIAISFIILILSCVLQVFTRFVLNNSLSWTEELSSPALRISMSFVYGAAPFSALFILYYSLFNIIKDYKNFIQEQGKND